MKKLVQMAAFAFWLSGCENTSVSAQISSFSSLTDLSHAESFYILPNEQQARSAEFNQYADSISRRLSSHGLYRVHNPSEANYLVVLDYGVAGSREVTGSIPLFGQTGGGTTTHSGTYNTFGSGFGTYSGTSYSAPTYGVVGSAPYSYTTYERYFQMQLFDTRSEVAVYETIAASSGASATFGQVSECIFDMAFKNFPVGGNSNESIVMDECGQ